MVFDSAQELMGALIQAYYQERNIEATLACVTDDIEWVGTEHNDSASGKEELRALLQDDISNYPESFKIELEEPVIQTLGEDALMVTITGHQAVSPLSGKAFIVRGTVCCVKIVEGWLVRNVHTSVPNAEFEKYHLEQQLIKIRENERALMASIPGGVAIYRLRENGKVATDYVSESLAKMCGYTASEFLEYLRDDSLINLVPEDVPSVMDLVGKSIEKNEPIHVMYRVYSKDRKEIMLRLDANAMPKSTLGQGDVAAFYAVHTVVSEESKNSMQEQHHYRTVLDMLGIAYWEWSKKHGFYASENYQKYALSKASWEDVRNNRVYDNVVHPDDVDSLKKFFEQGDLHKERASVIVRMGMTDGTFRWTEIFGFKEYTSDGDTLRMSCVMRDVDKEWIEQNEKLEAALVQAQEALLEAERAGEAKNEFLSRMSHDLRTPMNAIIGLSALTLDDANQPDVVRENMSKMRSASDFMLGLINDILDMAKIESGAVTLHCEPYSYKDFIINMKTMFQAQCEQKGITFHMEPPKSFPVAYVDKVRINQIFFNIISNAVKYTPQGGTITYRVDNIKKDGDMVSADCTISDNGIGMSEEFQKHLYEPFMQESDRVTPELQGSGLGLSITKQLVELMGGTIQIESAKGEGTSVKVHMVFQILENVNTIEESVEIDPTKIQTILQGKNVLLVEDHPLNTQIAKALLEKRHMSVIHAADGQRAVEILQASPIGSFDVILMDIRMPVMSGLEATKTIRSLEREDTKIVPIIAMTANAYDEDMRKSQEAGMNAHLSKPIDPKKLYETLARYMK